MSKRVGTDKDTQRLIRAAEKMGWTVTVTGGNHIKFLPPGDGDIIFGSLTGCGPGQRKLAMRLAKAGVTA